MTEFLVDLIKQSNEEEIEIIINLVLGRLAPNYENIEFNLAEKMVMRTIAGWLEIDQEKVLVEYKRLGDLGEVIKEMGQKKEPVTRHNVTFVFEALKVIANESGTGSQEKKMGLLTELLKDLSDTERKYVVRMVLGKLRLGFSDKTVLDALSVVSSGDKGERKLLDAAYQIRPDVATIAGIVKKSGVDALKNIDVKVGIPVIPALCQRLNSAEEIIEKMGEVGVERKFDGTRVQIHYQQTAVGGQQSVKTFTRNLEESSLMFPELFRMEKYVNAKSLVLDCEAVGYDPETKKILSFQITITRKRKHDVAETASKVPLRFYVFDVLEVDGETVINKSYEERRKILTEVITKNDVLVIDEVIKTDDPVKLHQTHEKFLKEGYEGAVIKKWDGTYLPGRQGWNWVKIKESEGTSGKLKDTLDCVVMGYYRGRGKRAGFGVGAFLVGVRKGEEFLTIAKIGTGISDEKFRDLKIRLDALTCKDQPKEYVIDKALKPDVYVLPKLVVEIAADELTNSPTHTAGLALRFPRLIKFRDDKDLDGVTGLGELSSFR
jgi:DNA ligase-1